MKKERLSSVWQIAMKLYTAKAPGLTSPKTSSPELAREVLKEKGEALARECFWLALYGISEVDKQFNEMHKRIKK